MQVEKRIHYATLGLFSIWTIIQELCACHWLLTSYLDDLFFFPVVLCWHRVLTSENAYKLQGLYILVSFAIVSVFTEFLLPLFEEASTPDIFDVLAYFIGILVYARLIDKSHLVWK